MSDQNPSPITTLGNVLRQEKLRQRDFARAMAFALIDEMKTHGDYNVPQIDGGTSVMLPELAAQMVEAVWPADGNEDGSDLQTLQQRIANIQDPKLRQRCSEMFAKLGHLYQMAGLLLRDLDLERATTRSTASSFLVGNLGQKKDDVPTDPITPDKLVYSRADEAVEALNRPRLEFTFTAHPTNTNDLKNMQRQRELSDALLRMAHGEMTHEADIKQALRYFLNAPLLPELANGTPGYTVHDETSTMLYFLNNVYKDLDKVYAGYDRALDEAYGTSAETYRPETLRLNLGLHSWGSSGDKDGNTRVNADTTLYALAQHYLQITGRYREELRTLDGLESWKTDLNAVYGESSRLVGDIRSLLDEHGHLSPEQYDRFVQRLREVTAPLNKQHFLQALEIAHAQAPEAQKPIALSLLRKVHTFGFSFGTIEYRETSEELRRIVAAVDPEYQELLAPIELLETTIAEKRKALNAANEEGHADLGQEIDALEQQLAAARKDARYPCAERLQAILNDPAQLRRFGDAWRALSANQAGKPYSKNDPAPIAYQTLKRLELARDFPQAITDHVLAECQGTSNMLELLVLQHAVAGDTGRRATLGIIPLFEDAGPLQEAPAIVSHALRIPAYRKHIDAVARLHGDGTRAQQVQLAHSDNARRNGLPAARGLIYRAHEELRATMDEYNRTSDQKIALQFYEGGSMTDSFRNGTRAFSATVNEYGLHDFTKVTAQGGDLLNFFNLAHSTYRLLMRNITHNAARLGRMFVRTLHEKDEKLLVNALIDTKDSYRGNIYENPQTNRFLEAMDFVEDSKAGNIGSRVVSRDSGQSEVDVTKIRTIAFSEGFQHNDINPSWFGAKDIQAFMRQHHMGGRTPTVLNEYYKRSPVFKDAIDHILFGLVRTDLDYAAARSNNHPMIETLRTEYDTAFTLCMEAYTGRPITHFTKNRALSAAEQREILINEVYPHLKDVLIDQNRYGDVLRSMKEHWVTPGDQSAGLSAEAANDNFRQRVLLHNGKDTTVHGRIPLLDDPTYQTLYCRARGIVRPYVEESRSVAA